MVTFFAIGGRTPRRATVARKKGFAEETKSVDTRGAKSAAVRISMRAGEINLSGGAEKFMDGDFRYQKDLKPEIDYKVMDTVGILSLAQKGPQTLFVNGLSGFRGEYDRWNVRLNNSLPMDMKVDIAAGRGKLRLGGLLLNHLAVGVGSGVVSINLTGTWRRSMKALINGGFGKTSIQLPANVGVRVKLDPGIALVNISGLKKKGGFYVNQALGKSAVTLDLEVSTGFGIINIEAGE
ncbi:MAG TPA: toast rack family protein [Candidatus Angelobacter sp.]|jgi:hypothetical protein|nr:toast rack family protein [Candidatus Angelobacter sp.]